MSRAQWVGVVAVLATLGSSTTTAASAADGPAQTVRAYVAAVRHHQDARICALVLPGTYRSRAACVKDVRFSRAGLSRVRINHFYARGAWARAIVDYVAVSPYQDPAAQRTRVVLRRAGGRWRLAATGQLPGTDRFRRGVWTDPRPSRRAPALLRLADDALVGLSGNLTMLCDLLAPGAPMGGKDGPCTEAQLFTDSDVDGHQRALELAGYAAHPIDARHARLDLTIAVRSARAGRSRTSPRIVTTRWRDRLYAVRVAAGWRLVKPSRSFYRVVGVAAPSDVDTPDPIATWPMPDAALPSLSDNPLPAECRVPPGLWGTSSCKSFDGFAAGARADGGGLVAWSVGFNPQVRPVAAGRASGAATHLPFDPQAEASDLWNVVDRGVLPTAAGMLVVEQSETDRAVRALAVDAAGVAVSAARAVDPGVENPDDGDDAEGVASAPRATVAAVLVDGMTIKRLRPDGSPAAPDIVAPGDYESSRFALLPNGSLLRAEWTGDELTVHRLGADGRDAAPLISVPAEESSSASGPGEPAVAVDVAGRLLAVWREDDGAGHDTIRAWVFDPAAPDANKAVTIARIRRFVDDDEQDYSLTTQLAESAREVTATALPGGGWGVAFVAVPRVGTSALWAARLAPGGAPATAPTRIASGVGSTGYASTPFAVAGDTVAWIAAPQIAGVPQVRSAPLP